MKKNQKNSFKIIAFCVLSFATHSISNASDHESKNDEKRLEKEFNNEIKVSKLEEGKVLMGLGALMMGMGGLAYSLYNHYQSDLCHYLSFNNS